MRLNKYIALATGMSRRAADTAIAGGRVSVDGTTARLGQEIQPPNRVTLDNTMLAPPAETQTILLNKPVGYVCSRNGQGSKTIYDLLPETLHHLKPVGRLDKDSSGLLLLTNDGQLAQQLTHPSHQKDKVYVVILDKRLTPDDRQRIEKGMRLDDGMSVLKFHPRPEAKSPLAARTYEVHLHEGRNRQIRRTFAAAGYQVTKLHRSHFGSYALGALKPGKYSAL
jgi:23S rRNA pseudouridine2605 synthase